LRPLSTLLCATLLLPAASPAGTLRYVGSSTVARFITEASLVYSASSFEIHTNPESLGGERCIQVGTCDLGGVAQKLSHQARTAGVVGTAIGKDALVVIVHPRNPVRELRSEQVKAIFTGQITNWSQVGGEDRPITPLITHWNSATRQVFQRILLEGEDYRGCRETVPDPKIVGEVAEDRGAVGQISLAFVLGNAEVRPLAIDGQEPGVDNPAYPVTRDLFLATGHVPPPEVQRFLDWALSPDGQRVVRKYFVGVR